MRLRSKENCLGGRTRSARLRAKPKRCRCGGNLRKAYESASSKIRISSRIREWVTGLFTETRSAFKNLGLATTLHP